LRRLKPSQSAILALPAPEPVSAVLPEEFAGGGISLAQLNAILHAYWKQSVLIALGITILGGIAIKLMPKTYTAQATLIVETETKDPLAGRDFPVEMLGNYVATQVELMMSPIVLLPVVDRLGLTHDKEFTRGFDGSPAALRETVERNVAFNIAVDRGSGGQLLYLWASAKEPEKAAALANTVADVYLEQDQQRRVSPATARAQRYTEELAELREKVELAQDKVTEYRTQHGMTDLAAASTDAEGQALDNLQQRLLETQNLRRSLEAKGSVEQSSTNEAMASDSVQASRTLLSAQLTELAQLSGTYGPQHPRIKQLNAQIAVTRQTLANETHNISENTSTELARAKDLEQKYLRAVAAQETKVLSLRQAQDEGGKLMLELESAKAVYKHALDGFDQIVFQSVANHTNVSIVSRALPPLRPSRPNRPKLFATVLMAAVGFGIGAPLLYGLFVARRVRCRDDIERSFGIPVLAQFDQIPSLTPTS